MVITLTLIYKAKIDGSITYSYDVKNNLAVSTNIPNGQFGNYRYDSFKQRVAKTVNGFTTYFVYNNGQLIGEYDANGNVISEHIYFGLRPIALYKNNQIMTVHSDYLGTPREVQSGNSTIWYWENTDVFGANLPTVSSIEYNLRFSGQYFDKENKLHYNINRTYNPKLGRYMQSDPLGLAPGFNTYQYVGMNPLNNVDPLGLDFISGSVQPLVTKMISNPKTVPQGYLGLGFHGIWKGTYINQAFGKIGGFQLEKESALYNMIDKDSEAFKRLSFDDNGNAGMTGKTLAELLKTINGLDLSKYQGIYLYACNSGISTDDKEISNAQAFANESGINTYAFDEYLVMQESGKNAFIAGSYKHGLEIKLQNIGFPGLFNILMKYNNNATNVRKLFKPQ